MRRGYEFHLTGSNWEDISRQLENIQSEFAVVEVNYSIDVTLLTERKGLSAKVKIEYDEQ